MFFTIYKTVNVINDKEYIGFHRINELADLLHIASENGSIFRDGYLGSGVLMKKALEKYGPLNMRQELILITEDEKEAFELERELVCREWIESDKTYNLCVGGRVCILSGPLNGFYGKKHSEEAIQRMRESRNKTRELSPFSGAIVRLVEDTKTYFINKSEACEYFNFKDESPIAKTRFLDKKVYEGILRYDSVYLQNISIKRYEAYLEKEKTKEERQRLLVEATSTRFKGVPKSPESNIKRGLSIKSWISDNRVAFEERMLEINRRPEKIAKTAEKHRGMKRSEEAKQKMSERKKEKPPKNLGMIYIHNPDTREKRMVPKDQPIPDGWVRGFLK